MFAGVYQDINWFDSELIIVVNHSIYPQVLDVIWSSFMTVNSKVFNDLDIDSVLNFQTMLLFDSLAWTKQPAAEERC